MLLFDKDEIKKVYTEYYDMMFSIAVKKIGDMQDALDICQDVFVIFMKKYNQINDVKKWLMGTLNNEIFNFLNVSKVEVSDLGKEKYNASSIWENPIYKFLLLNPQYNKFLNKYMRRLLRTGRQVSFKPPEIRLEAKKELIKFYENDTLNLEKFLGRDLSMWRRL